MRCFQVRETVTPGILLARDPRPHIPRRGLHINPLLEPELAEIIEAEKDEGDFYIERVRLLQTKEGLVFNRPGSRRDSDKKALVRIETAAGVNGRVFLTANVYKERFNDRGEVTREHEPFPPLGVHVFCGKGEDAMVKQQITEGIEFLDVLISMEPGSSVRLMRTGDLRDTMSFWHGVPHLFLHWKAGELKMTPDRARPPRVFPTSTEMRA